MKFDQLIEHNMRRNFLQKWCRKAENESGRKVSDLFLFFKKAFLEVKASLNILVVLGHSIKTSYVNA